MKKTKIAAFLLLFIIAAGMLSGCCLSHEWKEATCTDPKTCTKCGKTEGQPIGHDWQEASCEKPQTCKVCGKTEGNPKGHEWEEGSCEVPRTCKVCGKTEGKPLGHTWIEATVENPKTCEVCGKTEGAPLDPSQAAAAGVFVLTVQDGDTPWDIIMKYYGEYSDELYAAFCKFNGMDVGDSIQNGQELKIPPIELLNL